mmetsp:Transcript_53856/g.60181  ORF Transcript_53856/g.60181 Transcript_53856/m.60181 type:complete len:614 (-) Transcript_53856:2152-3993(-)
MIPSSATSDGNGGGGMSRAAKKRAKKKKKQSFIQTIPEGKIHVPGDNDNKKANSSDGNNDTKISSSKKRKKLDDPSSSSHNLTKSDIAPRNSFPPDLSLSEILFFQDCKDKVSLQKLKRMTTTQRAACLFQVMLEPITLEEFYKVYFEKKPLVISSESVKNKSRYSNLLSLESIKAITKKHKMYFGRDLNVTEYKKGSDGVKRRITLDNTVDDSDEEGSNGVRVDRSELWSNYEKGCTIRLLCPHKYSDVIQSLLSTLEVEFQCMVGANAYLTPARSSQGFAPHYDDIDAFCLQLQGSKRWKVYEPTMKLPRTSSEDLTAKDLECMKLVLDVTLNQGDLLYMPRGWIHQACTLKDNNQHSLHLTISTMQQWAWADLMEIVMPEALHAVATSESSTSLREGLPQGFMDYMGVMYEEAKDEELPEPLKKRNGDEERTDNSKLKLRALLKEQFRIEAKKRIMKVAKTACEMLDATCDEMGKRYISERQPPALTAIEVAITSQGDETADEKHILPNTMCRLVRPGIGRLVVEDNKAVIYHCFDNSREYQGNPINPLEFEMDDAASLEQLITTVEPDWILVNDLFHDSVEDKIQIVQALYDEGIIAIKESRENEVSAE